MSTVAAAAPARFVVMKFGGTSVAAKSRWENIARLTRAHRESGARVPSRHLPRFLDRLLIPITVTLGANGAPKVDSTVAPTLLGHDGRFDDREKLLQRFVVFFDGGKRLRALITLSWPLANLGPAAPSLATIS